MKTITLDEINQILQNRNNEQLNCFSVIIIPLINHKLFIENSPLLRNIFGLSLRKAANDIGITGQALSQFEKRKNFPDDKASKLLQRYLSKAIDYALEGNKLFLNVLFSLFFFTTINFPLTPETIKQKQEAFENLKKHIDDEIYKENYTDELNAVIKKIQLIRNMSSKSEREAFDLIFSCDNISMDTKPVLSALTRNLKNIRFLLDKDQYEMSNLLDISHKTYSFYENNLDNYTLNAYDACKIINELFNHFEQKNTENERLQKIIKYLFIQKTENDNTIITETLYDYCIAIKYKQSKSTIDYLEKKLTDIKLATIHNYPIARETEHLDTVEPDETIFN